MTLTRAAASSIASGSRSRRAHNSAIVASVRSPGMNRGCRCLARSTNRRCASSGSSGSSRQTVSPLTPSDSRLVAMIRTSPHEVSRAVASSAHASTTCSQLSSTSSTSRLARYRRSASVGRRPARAADVEHPRGLGRDVGSRGTGRQIHEPHPVGPPRDLAPGKLQREPRLADAARAGQRHQARPAQRLADPFEVARPADQRGQRHRDVVLPGTRALRGPRRGRHRAADDHTGAGVRGVTAAGTG